MKRILLAAAALVAVSSAAYAEGPAGQTFDVTAGETVSTFTFTADGGFTQTVGDEIAEGTFTYAEGELCLTPAGDEVEALCGDWTDLDIGESTTTTEFSGDGGEITITRIA
ncbi:MAG: hypothetical protein ACLFQ5_07300 [Oceanicaulis sp.]